MSPLGWGLVAFAAWVIFVVAVCAFLSGSRRPASRSELQVWENERDPDR